MSAPPELHRLIEQFADRRDELLGGTYNETQVRRDFLDPLFGLLGWNVGNAGPRSRSERMRDVVQEATVVVDGRTRFPDYAFRVGGRETFFAEAKKPSVNIDRDAAPAFQTRSYGWSAKHPLAVLTDFEEFALYDTRVPPLPDDDAKERRDKYIRFEEYPDRWDELTAILSREAVADGRFAAYAAQLPGGRKVRRREVDDLFLKDIERWREALAGDLAARNPTLTVRDLNFAVQATIDRIVFLRICEDRGLETHGTLIGLLGEHAYDRLLGRFEEADAKYNSGLFHFRTETGRDGPDVLTPNLSVGDDVLEAMIGGLYYPQSPYSFSVLPADILGQIYERFLGKVIVRTDGGAAAVEEKPEVRKAGGVYYTPTYIVDYIVGRTVGELLQDAAVTNAARADRRLDRPLRVLDPACGSGSFLLGAYQFLLDWYRDWYAAHDPEALAGVKNPPIRETAGGRGWTLTTAERKRILLAHVYGVDIDAQAVEVTKLSLLLKVLEGEPGETAGPALFAAGRVLPDLGANVKCGNSLIGTDFYDHAQGTLFDAEQRLRVNAFDWEHEFAEAMREGGFDAVIGNPPYTSFSGRQAVRLDPGEEEYLRAAYTLDGWATSHGIFLEKSAMSLARSFLGMIVPDQVGHLEGYESIRRTISSVCQIVEVRYWGERVFKNVVTPALTLVAKRGDAGPTRVTEENGTTVQFPLSPGRPWTDPTADRMIDRVKDCCESLGALVADPGVHTGNCSKKLVLPLEAAPRSAVPVLEGKQIGRYRCEKPAKVLNLGYRPGDGEYFTVKSEKRYADATFVIRQTAAYPIVGPREHASYFRNSLLALYPPGNGTDIRYHVALLNSTLLRYFYGRLIRESRQRAFPQVKVGSLRRLPIRVIDHTNPSDQAAHDRLVDLVTQMCKLHRQVSKANAPHDGKVFDRLVRRLDNEIDQTVFELYGLSPQEKTAVLNSSER